MGFDNKLKSMRKSQRLTQQQLADRLGVAKSVVSYYENGERFPSYDVLIKISRIFHVTTDYLLGVERKYTIDISDLSESDRAVVTSVISALKEKQHSEI